MKVRIGTFRIVPPTLSTLQMYSFSIGDQVTWLSDTGPRGAVIVTARIACRERLLAGDVAVQRLERVDQDLRLGVPRLGVVRGVHAVGGVVGVRERLVDRDGLPSQYCESVKTPAAAEGFSAGRAAWSVRVVMPISGIFFFSPNDW